ncbi:MAG: hypothetical protein A2X49_16535 [Lentisphaerae bacterium GWF2_52_8]|nr:MAG: hypothetical protein A2X49_16535 [Lentisphaerae bacterium GWF2_52_8]
MTMRNELNDCIKTWEPGTNGQFQASLRFPPSCVFFEGHFPDAPIVPGVVQLEILRILLERCCGASCRLLAGTNMKFFRPIMPDETLLLAGSYQYASEKSIALEARLRWNESKVSEFKLVFEMLPNA